MRADIVITSDAFRESPGDYMRMADHEQRVLVYDGARLVMAMGGAAWRDDAEREYRETMARTEGTEPGGVMVGGPLEEGD